MIEIPHTLVPNQMLIISAGEMSRYLLKLIQIFHFSTRFFSKMLIGFSTLSSLGLQISSGAHLKGLNFVIVVVYQYLRKY